MFKKIVVTLSILTMICLIGLGLSVVSPQAETVDNFKVHVDIICEDEITKSLIESHIKRELRALKDVDIIPLLLQQIGRLRGQNRYYRFIFQHTS